MIIVVILLIGDIMKKVLWFLILLLPFYVFAYSDYIISGGDTLGIEVNGEGLVVVGFYDVDGSKINRFLQVGDRILEVNDVAINSLADMNQLIKDNVIGDSVMITFIREDLEIEKKLKLVYDNGNYKTGLYIKESVLGIGTLTYIDPNTNVYGILGHSLNLSQTNDKFIISSGLTYEAYVTSFHRSSNGKPGSKNASLNKENVFGTIVNNTDYGIFGVTDEKIDRDLLKVGTIDDIKIGDAFIRTTDINNRINDYKIKILEIDKDNVSRNIYFQVTDKELLSMSGGIVQGMSGSPMIQNNMIVGAVTRVLVDDVSRGYGISIVTMLEEGDKVLEKD